MFGYALVKFRFWACGFTRVAPPESLNSLDSGVGQRTLSRCSLLFVDPISSVERISDIAITEMANC